jgi:hypothetical protein
MSNTPDDHCQLSAINLQSATMKILITLLVVACFLGTTSTAAAFDWNVPWKKDKQTEIEKDKSGGYSETQRDYKARKRQTQKEKEGAGYYGGEYHHKGQKYKKGEWQFVE